MKITVFTSNQPRHLSLIRSLAGIAEHVYAIQECNTVFPGLVADFFKKTAVMQEYFAHVIRAEKAVFPPIGFLPSNVSQLAIKMGDLNQVATEVLAQALESDVVVVFGATYIKPPLVDVLVEKHALNIHMGISPQYRGSSCNFWALYDGHPELVGATIHALTRGLDSGPMFFHTLPAIAQPVNGFELGMRAVKAAHAGLVDFIRSGRYQHANRVSQDKTHQIRYTRNADFTDEVARAYLDDLAAGRKPALIRPEELESSRDNRFLDLFVG